MGIQWRESLAIGVEEIDNQHKELLEHFDRLLAACEAGKGIAELKNLIGFLNQYVIKHFNDEEALQIKFEYPDYPAHKKEHEFFIQRIANLQEEINRDGVAVYHVIETNQLLFKWLTNHISSSDKKLGRFIQPMKKGN